MQAPVTPTPAPLSCAQQLWGAPLCCATAGAPLINNTHTGSNRVRKTSNQRHQHCPLNRHLQSTPVLQPCCCHHTHPQVRRTKLSKRQQSPQPCASTSTWQPPCGMCQSILIKWPPSRLTHKPHHVCPPLPQPSAAAAKCPAPPTHAPTPPLPNTLQRRLLQCCCSNSSCCCGAQHGCTFWPAAHDRQPQPLPLLLCSLLGALAWAAHRPLCLAGQLLLKQQQQQQ